MPPFYSPDNVPLSWNPTRYAPSVTVDYNLTPTMFLASLTTAVGFTSGVSNLLRAAIRSSAASLAIGKAVGLAGSAGR